MQNTLCNKEVGYARLIIGRLQPVRVELPRPDGASPREIREALAALDDRYDASERTIDAVVERLLTELTW